MEKELKITVRYVEPVESEKNVRRKYMKTFLMSVMVEFEAKQEVESKKQKKVSKE